MISSFYLWSLVSTASVKVKLKAANIPLCHRFSIILNENFNCCYKYLNIMYLILHHIFILVSFIAHPLECLSLVYSFEVRGHSLLKLEVSIVIVNANIGSK